MFGSNNSWANPQQNQQPPQQQQQQPGTSAFGQQQPNAFGSGGTGAAFGGGAFGQNSQQQPAANTMFGGTPNAASTTGTSGFGTFGGGGTSAFGAPKPSGFGGFGGGGNTGTSAFGGGGAFGQNTPATASTSAFGQPAGGTSAFGGAGLFGQKPAAPTGAFGSTSTGPTPGTGDAAVAPVTTGSSNPPYSVVSEKDTSSPGNVTLNYQSISTMPAYRGTSFEELRVQDYAQGRKTAGAFGQSATFGLTPSQSSTTAFGQPAASTSTFGGFGQNNQQPTTQSTNAFGSFGQPAASQPSVFGTATGTTAFGSFGQNAQQQQQQPQPQTTGASVFGGTNTFGQNPQQQPQTGTSGFGGFGQNNTQPKPFGTFGQTSGTSAFGTGGGFGQNNTQPAGQSTGGLFGQPPNQNQGTTAFGSFGASNNNALKPAFGQPASQPTATGFGLFGQSNQQQQQPNQPQGQQPSTGLFGGGGTTTGTGLFGQNQQQGQPQQNATQPTTGLFGQPAAQPSTNLFGGGGTGTGIFGSNSNNQNKPGFGGGLFGANNNQGANTGTAQPSTGLFGQPFGQSTMQPAPGSNAFGGTSLFGQKPATTNTFGQSTVQPTSTGLGGSLFGNSTLGGAGGGFGQSMAGVQGAGTLTASVAQPVQENLPIFSLLHSNTQAASLAPPPKKMSSFFVDVPMRSPLGTSSARLSNNGKLRGFGVSQSAAGLNRTSGLSATMALSKNVPGSLALSRGDSRSLLGPESFLGSPSLGSDGKSSPKKLVLHKKIDPSEVFGRSMAKAAASSSKIAFNPAMSMAAREKELFSIPAVSKPTQAASTTTASPGRKSAPLEKDSSDLQEGDYYVKPPLDVLRKLSNRELSTFEGLVVGRKGFGEVQFLDPVDLTTLPKLKDLLGKLVEIDNKEVCVYPDSSLPDGDKPQPGEGINVRARIILIGCWPVDKATGAPFKDGKSPVFSKHLKKLKNTKRTYFESYDVETGTWSFVVDHF